MSKVILPKCNINLAGAWNVGIFSPEWLHTEFPDIFASKNFEVSAAIGPEVQFQFKSDDIIISPSNRKLVIGLSRYSRENLGKVQAISSKIFEKLPHTPINAIGHNIDFELEENESFPIDLNPNPRKEEYEFCKLVFPDTSLGAKVSQYALTMEKSVLNLKLVQSADSRRVEFNFHYEIRNKQMIKDALASFTQSLDYANSVAGKIIIRITKS